MKNIFRVVFKRKMKLLNEDFDGNAKKHVIIYGACSHMGRITTSIFVKHGYSVVLIDVNLEKLQDSRLNIARTHCEQFTEETLNQRVKLLQLDLTANQDSNTLEKMFRSVLPIEQDDLEMPILVNTSSYGGSW